MRAYPAALAAIIGAQLFCTLPARAEAFRLLRLEGENVRWIAPITSALTTITYAFATRHQNDPGARNCAEIEPFDRLLSRSGLDDSLFRKETRTAFDMWERAANLRFVEIADTEQAEILIGAQTVPTGIAFTNVKTSAMSVQLPQGRFRAIAQARICLNPTRSWKIGFDGRLDVYDVRHTMAHEIGHAIGLDHPGPSGTLMSFRYEEKLHDLQAGDREGAAALYDVPAGDKASPASASGDAQLPVMVSTSATSSATASRATLVRGLGDRE